MDAKITYTNHKGEGIELGPESVYHYGKHALHDALLSYEMENGRVGSLRREPQEYELPIMIDAADESAGLTAREHLRTIVSTDMAIGARSRITKGGWTLEGVPVGISVDRWWLDDRYFESVVTLLAENPVWTKTQTFPFVPDRSPSAVGTQLDYPYDYPHDFTPNPPIRRIEVDAYGPCSWTLVVYGPATDPYVVIGGNRYQVAANVPTGGILIADSRSLSIIVRDGDGNETNAFSGRIRGKEGSGQHMWEPIKPGVSDVSWSNAFGWDVSVHAEREGAPCI